MSEEIPQSCFSCKENLESGETFLIVSGKIFHNRHFTCSSCSQLLEGKGYFEHSDKYLCKECYCNEVADKCNTCNKGVLEDGIQAEGKTYHRNCFCCFKCKKPLQLSYSVDPEGNIYCPECEAESRQKCDECGKDIVGSIIKAVGKQFHQECFKCCICKQKIESIDYSIEKGNPSHIDCNKKKCFKCNLIIQDKYCDKDGKSYHVPCLIQIQDEIFQKNKEERNQDLLNRENQIANKTSKNNPSSTDDIQLKIIVDSAAQLNPDKQPTKPPAEKIQPQPSAASNEDTKIKSSNLHIDENTHLLFANLLKSKEKQKQINSKNNNQLEEQQKPSEYVPDESLFKGNQKTELSIVNKIGTEHNKVLQQISKLEQPVTQSKQFVKLPDNYQKEKEKQEEDELKVLNKIAKQADQIIINEQPIPPQKQEPQDSQEKQKKEQEKQQQQQQQLLLQQQKEQQYKQQLEQQQKDQQKEIQAPALPSIQKQTQQSAVNEASQITVFYSYESLKANSVQGIDVLKKEQYLSDEEFNKLFKMTKPQFNLLKAWKQKELKQAVKLF